MLVRAAKRRRTVINSLFLSEYLLIFAITVQISAVGIMRNTLLYTFLTLFALPLWAQQVQWASEVVDKSSQYGSKYYAAHQALGKPNAVPGGETAMLAWAPAKEESQLGEFIHVGFTVALRIQQVIVVESRNAGAIKRITLYDEGRKRHIVYDNPVPQPTGASRVFSHTFPLTEYKVTQVSVELKTSSVPGSNHIDAIGISASDSAYEKEKNREVSYAKGLPDNAENLGIEINSAFAERLPIISPDGKSLWFARKYHPQNRGSDDNDDIWVSRLQSGNTWSRPINVGPPLNDDRHNFVFAVNPAGDKLWLANEYNSVKKDGISYSKKYGRTWSRPKNVRITDHYNNSPFVCYHISADEEVLLMSVERREGLGENDFYVSFKISGGQYSKPINLGSTINTVNDESSIFLAADGKTVYFSSAGHGGYGGYDMYRSQRLDNSWQRWSEPLNLGPLINTPQNDYNYSIPAKGDYAYFSRDNETGMSDLFRIKLPEEVRPEPVIFVTGQLVDASTKQPIGGVLRYEKERDKRRIGEIVSDDKGKFSVILPYGENVELYAPKKGYYPISEQIQLAENPEELDSDGSSPEEPLAAGSNSEIDALQLQIKELESDVTELEQIRVPVTDLTVKSASTDRPYASDPTLLRLQKQYETEVIRRASERTPLSYNEPEEDVEEDELAAMKRKFNEQNGISAPRKKTTGRRPVTSSETEGDDELSAMKRKFNQYNRGVEDGEFGVKQTEPDQYLEWEVIEENTRQEVIADLVPEVRKDLEKELLRETKDELAEQLSDKEQITLQRIKPGLPDFQVRSGTSQVEIPDWAADIKAELRRALEYEVRLELRRELRDEVKAELRKELKLQVKKELEAELRTELEAKIRAEYLAEQNRPSPQISKEPAPIESEPEPVNIPEPVYKEVKKEILLAPIKVGQIIPMNNIFFDSNESTLKPESFAELERVKAFLQENSNLVIEIGGHTNGLCSHIFADELSSDRADRVRQFLIEEGIPGQQIQTRGYGKTQPIAGNKTRAGRRKNQRVEMKILEIL